MPKNILFYENIFMEHKFSGMSPKLKFSSAGPREEREMVPEMHAKP